MELLTRTWRDLRRLLTPDRWFTFLVVGVLLTLEILGRRQASTDVMDAVTAASLVFLVWLIRSRHKESPLGWVRRLGNFLRQGQLFIANNYAIDLGVDLRGVPPLRRGLPKTLLLVLGLVAVEVLVMSLFAWELPLGMRKIGIRIFYLGWVAGLMLLWLSLMLALLFAIALPIAMIHETLLGQATDKKGRAKQIKGLVVIAYFSTLLMAGFLLPTWAAAVICIVTLAINLLTIAVPANPDITFLWRYRNPPSAIRAIPWGLWVTCQSSFLTLTAIDLMLLSCGSSLVGDGLSGQEAMPITTTLGLLLTWLAPGVLTLLVAQTVIGRMRDPARACARYLHLSGVPDRPQRGLLKRFFEMQGWQLHFSPTKPTSLEVAVEIVPQRLEPRTGKSDWPLRLTIEELQSDKILERLARRHEIQLRRSLVGGLQRLFKLAARRSFRRGSGLWVAPHYWFIPGLSRDAQEDEIDPDQSNLWTGIIGAPYHRILPRAVRHHVYVMLRALQIDMIFVEDGVGFRRFCRVLRALFEVYDVYGGKKRANEIHLQGVPGVRVLIHEYQLDEPFRSQVYPEPEYENLGRARILHIFKDRGEQEEPLETPEDLGRMPMPTAAM